MMTLGKITICFIGILIIMCLIRCVRGPRMTDRIVVINSIGTMTITIIAILAVMLEEAYLLDVCLIYAMISFVAVIVLTKIYTGVYREEHPMQEDVSKEEKSDGTV